MSVMEDNLTSNKENYNTPTQNIIKSLVSTPQ